MRMRRMGPWWVWVLAGWAALAAAAGIAVGRAIHTADHHEQPTRHDGPPYPHLPPDAEPSLAGAILALAYSTDDTSARYWLAICARRGADWDLQRQLWTVWQSTHRPHTIHPNPEDN